MNVRNVAAMIGVGFIAMACRPPDPGGGAFGGDAGDACAQFSVGAAMSADTFSASLPPSEAAAFAQHALAASEVSQWTKRELAALATACGTIVGAAPAVAPEKVVEACRAARNGLGPAGKTTPRSISTPCLVPVGPYVECQGACGTSAGQASTKCDLKANPVACAGGRLTIDCNGTCAPSSGSPTVECQAVPTSSTGREPCQGKCTSRCVADTTCALPCLCDGNCALPGPPVRCDGVCNADFSVVGCAGGRFSGGCRSDATCETACAVRARTKQACAPPSVEDTNPATTQAFARIFLAQRYVAGALTELEGERASVAQLPTARSSCLLPVLDEAAVALKAIASATEPFASP